MARPPDSYPEDVREAFEYCPDCETLLASLDQHTCPSGDPAGRYSAEERAELAAADDRPADAQVLIPRGRSANNAWAYHEIDEDRTARCGADHSAGAEIGPRAEAVDQGCYPCGRCRMLEDGEN